MGSTHCNGRYVVLVERNNVTMSPAMNVTREHAWEVARREREENRSAKVSILKLAEDEEGDPVCVLDWDEPIDR